PGSPTIPPPQSSSTRAKLPPRDRQKPSSHPANEFSCFLGCLTQVLGHRRHHRLLHWIWFRSLLKHAVILRSASFALRRISTGALFMIPRGIQIMTQAPPAFDAPSLSPLPPTAWHSP